MRTKDKGFLDTNVLLYLLSDNLDKKSTAKILLDSNYNISIQVLNEFSNICLNKFKIGTEDTISIIDKISEKTNIYIYTDQTITNAIKIKQKYKLQFYDSLIITTALENNCTILYSEDMQHNQIIENQLKIINPFIGLVSKS